MKIKEAAKILKNGGVGVLPTDTIYGIVASALDEKAVRRVYKLRRRNPKKPFITLISSLEDLKLFGIKPSAETRKILNKLWPGKVSIILPLPAGRQVTRKFSYLHRGVETLAFRLPAKKWLRDLIKKTGPLVAPSANPEGLPPAKTIKEAKKYFKRQLDFYVDAGNMNSKPSTLVVIEDGKASIIRKGAVRV